MFVFVKRPAVEAVELDPVVAQCYSTAGIAVSGALLLAKAPLVFSWWATAAAAVWVVSNVIAFPVVKYIGMAAGQGVWSGTIAVVSFLWGVLGSSMWAEPGDATACHMRGVGPALGGLGAIVAGILGLAFCSAQGMLSKAAPAKASHGRISLNRQHAVEVDPLLRPSKDLPAAVTAAAGRSLGRGSSKFVLGISLASIMGVFGGSVLVPMKMSFHPANDFADTFDGTLAFSLSFALSAVLVTAALFALRVVTLGGKVPPFHAKVVGLPCAIQGVLWNIGFVGSTIATNSPLGMSVGYPLTQCSMLIAGLWGVLYYREVTGSKLLAVFGVSGLVLCAGAIFLGLYGECVRH